MTADELQALLDNTVITVDEVATKARNSYFELYKAIESHKVFLEQMNKNLMCHDILLQKICVTFDIQHEFKNTDLH